MNRTLLTLVIGALATGLVLPGAAVAQGLDVIQESDADADDADDSLQNNLEVDYDGRDSAFATANCQLMVLADVWVVVLASADTLGVIHDEDEFEISQRNGMNGDGAVVTSDAVENSDTADSHCSSPVGAVNIEVQVAKGFGEQSPQGGPSDLLSAFQMSFGASEARIDQDDPEIDADADVDDGVKNDFDLNSFNEVDFGAAATGNCQALIGAHSGVMSIGLASATGHVEDSDSFSFTPPADGLGTSEANNVVRTSENQRNDSAAASCNQSIESIRLVVGRDGGAGTIPGES